MADEPTGETIGEIAAKAEREGGAGSPQAALDRLDTLSSAGDHAAVFEAILAELEETLASTDEGGGPHGDAGGRHGDAGGRYGEGVES